MFSDIDFSVWLGHLATKYSIPRAAVDELLHGFRALLEGTENNIPKNWNQLFQKLKQYGVPVVLYDVCQDDCAFSGGSILSVSSAHCLWQASNRVF